MIRENFNRDWTWFEAQPSIFTADVASQKVTLPHDAMILKPRDPDSPNKSHSGYRNGSEYTYEKRFFVPEDYRDRVVVLEFEGVYDNAMVYINKEFAGKCPYGYTEFHIEANEHLKYGAENIVSVVMRSGAMPTSRWYTGNGIYRNVNLYVGALVHIPLNGVRVTTEDADGEAAVVRIDTTIRNCGRLRKTANVETKILDANGQTVASDRSPISPRGGGEATLRQRVCVRAPKLWCEETPYLYTVETRVEVDGQIVDTSSVATGLRILRLDPLRGLRVNGVSVKLRGACIHHTNGILGACTFARAEERRVEQLKAAGFNAIRSSHNPMSRSMLEACDRLGMYVMEESFDQWNKSKTAYDYALHFNEWWERDLEALVAKDYNHPCVVMYSIGNEICELFERDSVELNRKMADKLRAMDPTRYVTNCINGMLCIMDEVQEMVAEQLSKTKKLASEINEAMNSMSRNEMREMVALNPRMTAKLAEPCASLDITGYNYMADRCEVDRECTPNRVIVGSETFPKDIAHNWAYVKKYPNVIGDFTWTGLDYLGEAGIARHDYDGPGAFAGAYPYCSGGCGDIDLAGQRLPISYYREIVFGLRRDPYIAVQRPERYGQKHYTSVWGWSDSMESWTWPGFENKPIIAEVYAAADEVEIYVNGVSQGRKPIGESHNYKAEFETQYIPGEILAVAYTDGVETGRFSIKTASKPAALLAVPDRIVLKDDTQDICHISLCIADSNGLCNPADDREISVRVEGSGVLQGFGNANPLDAADYTQSRCRTYRGHALAAVRPTSPGEIRVILEADGLPTVEVSLNVESEITA